MVFKLPPVAKIGIPTFDAIKIVADTVVPPFNRFALTYAKSLREVFIDGLLSTSPRRFISSTFKPTLISPFKSPIVAGIAP